MNMQKIILALFLVAAIACSWWYFSSATGFSKTQEKEIGQLIHNYLLDNPEVLVEASQELQRKQIEKKEKAAQSALAKNTQKILSAGNPELGSPNGDTIMLEFLDYQCGHCKHMEPIVAELIKDNPSLRVIFMSLPIFGKTSTFASKAAIAAAKQGKFAEMHKALLKEKSKLSEEIVLEIAKKNGLNIEQLKKDMALPETEKALANILTLARSMKIEGTPFFVVMNGPSHSEETAFIVPGASSKQGLQQLIDKLKNTR